MDQMRLGDLIDVLKELPPDLTILHVGQLVSYRGEYADLAFTYGDQPIQVRSLLAVCQQAVGGCFHGYKGGSYRMSRQTRLWKVPSADMGGHPVIGLVLTARENWLLTEQTDTHLY